LSGQPVQVLAFGAPDGGDVGARPAGSSSGKGGRQ
jgi:hypothetical protein